MTDKEKLEKLKKLADAMYYAAQHLTTDASRLHKAMDEYHKFIIHEYHKEEPVSEDLEEAASRYAKEEYSRKSPSTLPDRCKGCYAPLMYAFKAGAEWQKAKDESATEDLGEYINELSKQFPEVSFAKLSRIAVRVAQWQKQQIMKDAVEGEIVKDIANNLYIGKAKVNKNNFKFGDKVKLLVLKEE